MTQATKTLEKRRNIYSGGSFEQEQSYSRAVMTGQEFRLSGTTGFDYATDTLVPGAKAQTEQLFRNAAAALAQVNGTLKDIVRVRIYVARNEDYDAIMGVYADTFRGIDPACTTVQVGLFEPEICVEMDMDAVIERNG